MIGIAETGTGDPLGPGDVEDGCRELLGLVAPGAVVQKLPFGWLRNKKVTNPIDELGTGLARSSLALRAL